MRAVKKQTVKPASADRRQGSRLRRDLNTAFRDERGNVSTKKVFAVLGQAADLALLLYMADYVVQHWEILIIMLSVLIAPDMLMRAIGRVIDIKYGAANGNVQPSK